MDFTYNTGFMIIDSKKSGPLYAAPHAALAFYKPGDNQDYGTHYIAYRLANIRGNAIISTVTRERDLGIDFYREPPPKNVALKYYNLFKQGEKLKTLRFRKKYAWAAKNEEHHKIKLDIFNNFWDFMKENRSPIFFIHRQYLNPIRHPSIMDVVAFNHIKETRRIVSHLNKKYQKMLCDIFPLYKDAFFFKNKCIMFKKKLEKELRADLFGHEKPSFRDRIDRFNKKIQKQPFLEITYRRNFKGDSIKGIIDKHFSGFNYPIVQLEISEFLTRRIPDMAVLVVNDLVKSLVN